MRQEIKERIEQIRRGEVPEGYKRTKVGVIPEDWEVKHLDEIAIVNPRKEILDDNTLVSFVGMSDISEDARIMCSHPRLYKEVSNGYTPFKEKDVLVAKITPCFENGKGAVVENLINRVGFGSTEFHVIRPNTIGDEYFIFFHTLTERFRKTGEKNMTGSAGQKRIPKEFIQSYLLPYPKSRVERSQITSLLKSISRMIELKEKLTELKKLQKKGLMQLLLTGQTRLPVYKTDWEKVKLGDVLKERKEIGYSHLELLAITSSKGVVRRSEVDIKDTSSEDKSKYKRILPGDIGYNTMRMWQGVSGVSRYEGIVSPAYTILKPTDKVDAGFIGYLFKLPLIINLFRRYSQGLVDDNLNLKYENFKVIKVKIPRDINEQKAIAEILRCSDTEIHLLEKEIKYLKHQKKGLIQLLLAGMVRVHELEIVEC